MCIRSYFRKIRSYTFVGSYSRFGFHYLRNVFFVKEGFINLQ